LRRHSPALRATLLAAFCHRRMQELTDTLVELLISLIHRIGAKAERKVEKELLDDLKRISGKTGCCSNSSRPHSNNPMASLRRSSSRW
jgi:hypothetical protein